MPFKPKSSPKKNPLEVNVPLRKEIQEMNQDDDQFLLPEELEILLETLERYGESPEHFIPDGGFVNISDGDDEGEKHYLLRFANGFMCNAGMIINNIRRHGQKMGIQILFNEMLINNCFVPSWKYDKVR
jgi:hypothetical protein